MNAIPQIARCMMFQEPAPISGWMWTEVEANGVNLVIDSGRDAGARFGLMLKWETLTLESVVALEKLRARPGGSR